MKRRHCLTGLFSFLCILILILDGKTAIEGAREGIDLCIRTVIPSLFPFFVLSLLLTQNLLSNNLSILIPFSKLFQMPAGTESILLSGFLGGYPSGAQSVSTLYQAGKLSKQNAERLLTFCCNAGPSFLFGMVSPMFHSKAASLLLWGIHIFSALLESILISPRNFPAAGIHRDSNLQKGSIMRQAITIMATVCSWVVLFRVILTFLDRWFLWMLPDTVRVIIVGILELSNGCCELACIENASLRFVICSGMLAWGGLCVAMQTHSVISGLSMGAYMKGKLLQTAFSLLIGASVVLKIWFPVSALLLFLVLFIQNLKNKSGNPLPVGV